MNSFSVPGAALGPWPSTCHLVTLLHTAAGVTHQLPVHAKEPLSEGISSADSLPQSQAKPWKPLVQQPRPLVLPARSSQAHSPSFSSTAPDPQPQRCCSRVQPRIHPEESSRPLACFSFGETHHPLFSISLFQLHPPHPHP